ncbi:hypothetical protein FTUN_8972 [Frigoriglobus tundricola]|uniref:Uncharacterized protein n=1 Tax=Frigoriglobus tundricola TaxID=2774151 RepID=A0A6M5Z4I2_9BACT|nr:hypothetical protein FTUN_8972 [Frigoriglobus tundricola]
MKALLGVRTGLVMGAASFGAGPSSCGHKGTGCHPPSL